MIDEPNQDEATSGDEFNALTIASIRAFVFSIIPPRILVSLLGLVMVGSLLISPSVDLLQPPGRSNKPQVAETIPAPSVLIPKTATVPRSVHGKASRLPRPIEPVYVPDVIVANSLIHMARRGESLTSIARRYLSQTVFMTTAELESAIRQGYIEKGARFPSPGDQVVIPGYETAPIVERAVSIAKGHEVRAIYLTGLMAGSKQGIYLIRRWKELGGNAIVFDVKDSDGSVSVPFNHDLAPNQHHHYIENLPKFARFLHSLGLHSIARIAVFRDEQLVRHHPQMAVLSRRSNQPWRENGKLVWTDPSRPEVQTYNIALAKLAATSGIDEVQFDYIRFPAEGDQKDAQFFFQAKHPEWRRSQAISDFLSRAYSELHPLGVLVSLDVFGVMAWQRQVDLAHTGQDIAAMAGFCDVLSPMIYPSHFFGMDGYAHPGDAPEHFIRESMERFEDVTADSGVVLRPWLQAFAWRTKTYSPGYILRQVIVANDNGGIGYLFWNARNDYSKPFMAMPELRTMPAQSSSAGRHRTERIAKPATAVTAREIPAPHARDAATPHPVTHSTAP